MKNIKYLVFPGYIGSHYLSFNRLVELYNVNPKECINYEREMRHPASAFVNAIHLRPQESGVYKHGGKEPK